MPERSDVIAAFIELYRTKVEQHTRRINEMKEAMKDMPGRMQSRYDSSRQETSYAVDKEERELADWQEVIGVLAGCLGQDVHDQSVGVGSLVQVTIGSSPMHLLLTSKRGGDRLAIAATSVTTVSLDSPLGKALGGRLPGERLITKLGAKEQEVTVVRVHNG